MKGGGTGAKDIGRLAQVMQRERAPLGVFITAENPTRPMEKDAAAVGGFEDEWGRTYAKLQIITLAELFQGKRPHIPLVDPSVGAQAEAGGDGAAGKAALMLPPRTLCAPVYRSLRPSPRSSRSSAARNATFSARRRTTSVK